MTQAKKHVVLLFGGRSAEHEISIRSARSVFANLDPGRYTISCLYINPEGRWRRVETPAADAPELNRGRFHSFLPWEEGPAGIDRPGDIYFPVLHGPFGEDGTIQGLFELADVPYIGAAVLASAAAMDKAVAKSLFRAAGLQVARFRVIREPEWRADTGSILMELEREFPTPCYVKPANLGSSIGITKVKSGSDLKTALETAFRHDRKVLVEESVSGREIECSVLGNDRPRASLPGEIFPAREFYDYQDKYLDGKTRFGIPADLPKDVTQCVQDMAVKAYQAVDCAGMARVDFFIRDDPPTVFLNEINTIPGFTDISMYPKLWDVSGLPFAELLNELIQLGFERHRNRRRPRLELPI